MTLPWPALLYLNVPGCHDTPCANLAKIPAMLPSRGPEALESSDLTRLLRHEGSGRREPFLHLLPELVLPFQTPAALPRHTASPRKSMHLPVPGSSNSSSEGRRTLPKTIMWHSRAQAPRILMVSLTPVLGNTTSVPDSLLCQCVLFRVSML